MVPYLMKKSERNHIARNMLISEGLLGTAVSSTLHVKKTEDAGIRGAFHSFSTFFSSVIILYHIGILHFKSYFHKCNKKFELIIRYEIKKAYEILS